MDFTEYQELAMRTSGVTVPHGLLSMACMGLIGEAGEVVDIAKKVCFHKHELDKEKLSKEVGDVLWYVAAYAKATDQHLLIPGTLWDIYYWHMALQTHSFRLAAYIGKLVSEEPLKRYRQKILLELVITELSFFAYICGKEISVIMEENIDKLRKRYPEGFSAERSINRED